MPECPYCGRWFRTKKGLNQHISRAHTTDIGGEKMLNPLTFDIFGAMERRKERRKRRARREPGLFEGLF